MANSILHKASSVTSTVPTAGSLVPRELALNTADGRLFTKTTGGTVVEFARADALPVLDPNLVAIAALAGTSGFLKKTAADTWALDTTVYTSSSSSMLVPTYSATAAHSSGFGFWGSTAITYGIQMSTAVDVTYGGRIAGETTSDYNMYFTMTQGTNRGFVFRNSYATPMFAINSDGIRSNIPVTITGALYATSKSFKIDHPTKPDKKLVYGSLEGPEHGIYIRGKLTSDNKIELPEYWSKLVDPETITVQLTAIGRGQQLYVDSIENNTITVGNDNLIYKSINCYYFVQAERADIEKLQVEV